MKQQEACDRDQQAKGRVKEAVGNVTGDKDLERAGARHRNEGVIREVVGTTRHRVGKLAAGVGKATKE